MIRLFRFIRDLRLIPVAVIASACLLALKSADLVLGGGSLLTANQAAADAAATVIHAAPGLPSPGEPPRSWAQQMFNFPDSRDRPPPPSSAAPLQVVGSADPAGSPGPAVAGGEPDITGTVPTTPGDKGGAKARSGAAPAAGKGGIPPIAGIPIDGTVPHGAERAILERLQQRRQELDTRARELDIREGLVAAAEKRVDGKLAELKQVESQITVAAEKKDATEAARLKGLVTMYENMKPRDAAKIFDRLEIGVLLDVASQINPRRMADILAQMSPDTAERLTVELASRVQAHAQNGSADLPKIEGRPTTP